MAGDKCKASHDSVVDVHILWVNEPPPGGPLIQGDVLTR